MKLRRVRSMTTAEWVRSSSKRRFSAVGMVLRSSSPASDTIEASPSSRSTSTVSNWRGGAAPLDRSTRSPQRAIPFWCAAPMGQGVLKS